MQLIYGGKTTQSLTRYEFPAEFPLSVNRKHYSNQDESIKFIDEILVPYIKTERERLELPNQEALVNFDVFKGQVTQPVLDLLKQNNIAIVFVPANMTHLFQPLDLTVNGYAKNIAKRSLTNGIRIKFFSSLMIANLLKK